MFLSPRLHARPASFILTGLVLAAILAPAIDATTLVRYEQIPALVEESRRAVVAEVIDVRYGFDERKLHSTWVTLNVEQTIYGEPPVGSQLKIKIYGAPIAMADGTRLFIEGTPLYRRGERYLLLLREESDWGFTNTSGLFQGAFALDEKGEARSLGGNRAVFGESGLISWLDADEIDPAARARLVDPDAGVPVSLLRSAVERAWLDLGRLLPETGVSEVTP